MHLVGMFAAHVVLDDEVFVKLQLSKPLVKQVTNSTKRHINESLVIQIKDTFVSKMLFQRIKYN